MCCLPKEILCCIFNKLDTQSRITCGLVCKEWSLLVFDPYADNCPAIHWRFTNYQFLKNSFRKFPHICLCAIQRDDYECEPKKWLKKVGNDIIRVSINKNCGSSNYLGSIMHLFPNVRIIEFKKYKPNFENWPVLQNLYKISSDNLRDYYLPPFNWEKVPALSILECEDARDINLVVKNFIKETFPPLKIVKVKKIRYTFSSGINYCSSLNGPCDCKLCYDNIFKNCLYVGANIKNVLFENVTISNVTIVDFYNFGTLPNFKNLVELTFNSRKEKICICKCKYLFLKLNCLNFFGNCCKKSCLDHFFKHCAPNVKEFYLGYTNACLAKAYPFKTFRLVSANNINKRIKFNDVDTLHTTNAQTYQLAYRFPNVKHLKIYFRSSKTIRVPARFQLETLTFIYHYFGRLQDLFDFRELVKKYIEMHPNVKVIIEELL